MAYDISELENGNPWISDTKLNTLPVMFNKSIALPDEYNFTDADTTDEEVASAMNYLLKEYASLVPFIAPQNALFSDYNIYGDRSSGYYAFDSNGSIKEQILNYNFSKVTFAPDDNGKLYLIHIFNLLSAADKIGDYPLITHSEAIALLLNGNYITSVPEKMPGQEYMAKVELMYKTSNINEIYIPYYRFLVEHPDMELDNGLKTYGAYYVPAVQQQYIANLPIWDGSFN